MLFNNCIGRAVEAIISRGGEYWPERMILSMGFICEKVIFSNCGVE